MSLSKASTLSIIHNDKIYNINGMLLHLLIIVTIHNRKFKLDTCTYTD